MRIWLQALGAVTGLLGAAGVALAAVGAHLSGNPIVTTAAHFLLFHAAALLGLCAVARPAPRRDVLAAGSLIALGVLLFSGDLALRGLLGLTPLRLAAPTGGLVLILGWLVAAASLPAALGRADP